MAFIQVKLSPFKGTISTPPAPWPLDKQKCFQEFPEAQGRVWSWTEAGRVFQTRGPAMVNDRSPIAVRDLRTSSKAMLAERMPVRRWPAPGLQAYPAVRFAHLFWNRELLEINGTGLYRPDAIQSLNKQHQGTEGNWKHWPQSRKITHWLHPFFIQHCTLEGSGTAAFMMALQCQYLCK